MTLRIHASYDDITDVLYLRSGRSVAMRSREDEAGLVLRYDLGSDKPVGVTIVDFREYWGRENQHLVSRLSEFFGTSVETIQQALRLAETQGPPDHGCSPAD